MLNDISDFLGVVLTPCMLILTCIALVPYINTFNILRPRNFIPALFSKSGKDSASPWRSLSVALAGTLGIGNITGVASALISGGPGAVFWMWTGAVIVISVKYAEVYLALRFRRRDSRGWYGGAAYYIGDGLGMIIGKRMAHTSAVIFSFLCIANSLITGNIVQSNAAACILPDDKRIYFGIFLGMIVFMSVIFGTKRIEKITSGLIPCLAFFYMAVCLFIIISNIQIIPKLLGTIITSAFSGKAVFGGAVGFSVREAVRFGIMRGIFSNEAGCGTSPAAHASADTDDIHSQACRGIFEVIFDTLILCTMTAFVLLIADDKYSMIPWHSLRSTSAVTLDSFRYLANDTVGNILTVSIVLFAYATIIAQFYYGTSAIKYLTNKKWPMFLYSVISALCSVSGSVIPAGTMWMAADMIIGIMTSANCIVIILLRNYLPKSQNQPDFRSLSQ